MQRRTFLVGSIPGILGLSGCQQVTSYIDGEDKTLLIGTPRTHRGLKITPGPFFTASEVSYDLSNAQQTQSETAPSGATFLLTQLQVTHVGENKRRFPGRTMGDTGEIEHLYNGETQYPPRFEDFSTNFKINGETFKNYHHEMAEETGRTSVYEGSVTGWLINEVPADFSPRDMEIKISWGSSSIVNDENEKTYTWTFSQDHRRSKP